MKFLLLAALLIAAQIFSPQTATAQTQKTESFSYGDSARQTLDVYPQPEANPAAPVLIFVHGGGWSFGSKSQYKYLGKAFEKKGIVVVTINYRLHPETTFPGYPEDAASAVAWVSKNIAKYGGDPKRLFLMGHSAGAHSVALLGLDETYLKNADVDPSNIKGVIPISGPLTMRPSKVPRIKRVFGEATDDEVAPIKFVDGDAKTEPPFLLLHGKKDTLVPSSQSEDVEKEILGKGGRAKGIYYPKHDHISIIGGFAERQEEAGQVIAPVIEFIQADGNPDKVKSPLD